MEAPICRDDARRDAIRRHTDEQGQQQFNGLDYLEVGPDEKILTVYFLGKLPAELREDRKELTKYVRIEGGRRIRNIKVLDVDPYQVKQKDKDDYLIVRVDKAGDFSTYTLRLVNVEGIDPRYDHIDFTFKVDCPSEIDCAAEMGCPPPELNEPEVNYLAKDYASFRQLVLDRLALIMPDWQERHVPDIGIALVELLAYVGDHLSYYQDAVATEAYLDTARQRVSVRRHARLVDYIIHEGTNARAWLCVETSADHDLDPQDAYFITGLGDAMADTGSALKEDELLQLPEDAFEVFEPLTSDPRQPIRLYAAHNEMRFYTWGNRECCLARGATSATLEDAWTFAGYPSDEGDDDYKQDDYKQYAPQKQKEQIEKPNRDWFKRALNLKAGDVLIFEEVIGPNTSATADADPSHRHAVRLTRVELNEDALLTRPVKWNGNEAQMPVPLVEIEWADEDALPFPLCVSATGRAPGCAYIENVSVARGNVILVDHGKTVRAEDLGVVPVKSSDAECLCEGRPGEISFTPGRFEPRLRRTPLTYSEPLSERLPAARSLLQDARKAMPQAHLLSIPPSPDALIRIPPPAPEDLPLFKHSDLEDTERLLNKLRDPEQRKSFPLSRRTLSLLEELGEGDEPTDELRELLIADMRALLEFWSPLPDLLGSDDEDRHFVVEIGNDGVAHLRFGNNESGAQPPAGAGFYATYRVGVGSRGNVGAEAIRHLVLGRTTLSGISLRVRNPLPARGGIDPEPMAEAKLYAPSLFRKQLARAVTAKDYAHLTEREFKRETQRATAQLTWTGSWYEASVAVDAFGGEGEKQFLNNIEGMLHRYRRMGHDVAARYARRVPLDIALMVCVRQGYLRGHVEAALLDVFSNRALPGGRRGYFHPDNLTFGEGIYLSRLVATAHAVPGVESVQLTKLQRLFEAPNHEIENGVLPLGPFEVAQLDNDPSFPEHGRLDLVMKGGR